MSNLKFRVWLPDYNQMIYPHNDDFIRDKGGMVIGRLNVGIKYNIGLEVDMIPVISNFCKDAMGEIGDFVTDIKYDIQFCTGKISKNGKDIFQGDIVKAVTYDEIIPSNNGRKVLGFIYWSPHYAAWYFETRRKKHHLTGERYPFGSDDNCWVEAEDMKIVGNIFENPKLISPET